MKRYVVDASVAVKWFFPEVFSDQARHFLTVPTLLVPDLLYAELGSVLWQRIRKNELTEEQAVVILHTLDRLSLQITPSSSLIQSALKIANIVDCSIYDSLYVALAQHEKAPLVTADKKLYTKLQQTEFASRINWVEDALS